ncbi:uncharacterized protein BDV17DRAFT_211283 [Aspergillus undulatus]|uniref:uncharacterized protein n=1 Tax=Aspergillus undulatus TaxID=1810928 RepID=UPI003CCDDDF7
MVLALWALAAATAAALMPAVASLDHGHTHTSGTMLSVSQLDWEVFNASVSGRLHDGIPMLAPCYGSYDGGEQTLNTETCSILQGNRQDHLFVSDQFGGYQESNWAGCQASGDNCAMKMTVPDLDTPTERECLQGSVPRRYVDARGVEDVQRTLAFAREKGLRLVVKNTGHDYRGRSSAPESFALWTHNIQPPIELTENFIPDECSDEVGDVITFGAGQQFGGVYEFANAHGYRVVGGTSPSVGIAGGWTAGGGHSMLSNELGLGVDNVQQINAFLPNGTYITANRCQNQDIFFALRGGGGGTFGVVTEMSYSVHPKKPMQFARVSIAGINEDVISEFFSIVVANADRWAAEGWGGYIIPAAVGGASTVSLGTTMLDLPKAKASMRPLFDLAGKPADSGTLGNASVITADYHNILQAIIAREEKLIFPSSALAFSSRLVPRESFDADNQQQLASTLHDILTAAREQAVDASSTLLIYAVAPSLYSRTMPESDLPGGTGASSVTPAWRNGLWHIIFTRQFDGTTTEPSAVQHIWQTTHDIINPLRDLTPSGGAYQNEADPFEPNPIESFWGRENYERLLRIKREVDPTNLLTVHGGIGWDEADERYSCYPDIKV